MKIIRSQEVLGGGLKATLTNIFSNNFVPRRTLYGTQTVEQQKVHM